MEERKISFSYQESNPDSSVIQLIAYPIPAELSQLLSCRYKTQNERCTRNIGIK
jgi:hypothetical protein